MSSKAFSVLLIMFVGAIFQLTSTVIITRLLSEISYGAYVYSISIAALIGSLGCGGANRLLQREVARSSLELPSKNLAPAIIGSILTIVLLCPVIAVLLSFGEIDISGTAAVFIMVCAQILAIRTILDGALLGSGRAIVSSITENIARPAGIAMFIAFFYFYAGERINPIIGYLAALFLLLIFQCVLVAKFMPYEWPSRKVVTDWISKKSGYFKANFGLNLLNSMSPVLIGLMSTAENVAMYAVAQRLSNIVLFALGAGNRVFAPKFAKIDDLESLQILVAKVSLFAFGVGIIFSVGLYYMKTQLLGVFGESYVNGTFVVDVLILTTLFSCSCGPCGMLLSMKGKEEKNVISIWVSVVFSLIFSILLVPDYGASGAALAVLFASIILNVFQVYFVYSSIGIYTGVMSIIACLINRKSSQI